MNQLLKGIRVCRLRHVGRTLATHLLRRSRGGHQGGIAGPRDAMRYYGADRRYDGMAPEFIAVRAGKKSLVLDLKDAGDLELARRLIARSDVLVENFRPGVMHPWP